MGEFRDGSANVDDVVRVSLLNTPIASISKHATGRVEEEEEKVKNNRIQTFQRASKITLRMNTTHSPPKKVPPLTRSSN